MTTRAKIKQALYKDNLQPFDYLDNLMAVCIFESQKQAIKHFLQERENIAWRCASCMGTMVVNIMEFESMKEDDYLCHKCKDNIKTNALKFGIMKSSNNLFQLLQSRLYKNYGKTSLLS